MNYLSFEEAVAELHSTPSSVFLAKADHGEMVFLLKNLRGVDMVFMVKNDTIISSVQASSMNRNAVNFVFEEIGDDYHYQLPQVIRQVISGQLIQNDEPKRNDYGLNSYVLKSGMKIKRIHPSIEEPLLMAIEREAKKRKISTYNLIREDLKQKYGAYAVI